MLKSKIPQVQPGQRFAKAGDPHGKLWEVIDVADAVDGIPHAHLRSCDGQGVLITIAVGVLADPAFWRAVRDDRRPAN